MSAPSLEKPKDVFELQNTVSDSLNKFQIRYGRYMRCQNEDTAQNVTPPCEVNTIDSFSELTKAYGDLYENLEELETVYTDQSHINAKTNQEFQEDEDKMLKQYSNVVEMRKKLDEKLRYIQENSGADAPAQRYLTRRNTINLILVIIGLCLTYYLLVPSRGS